MSGQFAIKVTVVGVPQYVSKIRKTVKSSQKVARIFRTRTMGVMP